MAIAFAAVVLVQPHLFLFEQLFIVTSVSLSSSSLLQFLVKKKKTKILFGISLCVEGVSLLGEAVVGKKDGGLFYDQPQVLMLNEIQHI